MKLYQISLVATCFLAAALWGQPSGAQKDPSAKDTEPKAQKTRGKFTVGKETTFVTGPLDEDGRVDYAAALNERLGKGITAENNANVLIWKALGPHPEGARMPPEFFKLLGIEAPPEKGDYFIDLSRYIKEHAKIEPGKENEEIFEPLSRCTQRPWTEKDDPHIASWLKANERPLAVVLQATRRPQYFSPLVPKGSSGLIGALLPAVQKCREIANALVARALLRAAQGDADAAWQDLRASHRLGRLVGRGPTLIEALVSIAIDAIASKADLAFLERTRPDTKHLQGYLRDLQKLPPLPDIADKVDLAERFLFLDVVMMIDRHGLKYLEGLSGGSGKESHPFADAMLLGMDWDPALRASNRWYDRLVAAMRNKNRTEREKALNQIEKELKEQKARLGDFTVKLQLFLADPKNKGKVLGDVLVCLLVPAVRKVQSASDRAQQNQDNLMLAFALAWYQRDHGHYPKELAELAPRYLPAVPGDLFSGKPLVYQMEPEAYILYSVGINGKDDGGRGYDDQPPGDDLVIRMPLPPLRPNKP
jgi:hypothetical protein